jgi:hypothetical protein
MSVSFLRASCPFKTRRHLKKVRVVQRSEFEDLDLDAKVDLIRQLDRGASQGVRPRSDCRSPVQRKASLRGRAVAEVQVDEGLIRHPDLFRECLEIADRVLIEPDGDLLPPVATSNSPTRGRVKIPHLSGATGLSRC